MQTNHSQGVVSWEHSILQATLRTMLSWRRCTQVQACSANALSWAPNSMSFCKTDLGNHTKISLISFKYQCVFAVVSHNQHLASFTASLSPTFCLQVRSLISARCVEKPLVKAPTSSPTVGSTQASSPLAVICVAKASNERWIYGDTGRHSTAWNESQLQYGKCYNTMRTDSLGFPAGPCLEHGPWHYLSEQELKEEGRGQSHVLTAQPEWLWRGKVKAGFLSFSFPRCFWNNTEMQAF